MKRKRVNRIDQPYISKRDRDSNRIALMDFIYMFKREIDYILALEEANSKGRAFIFERNKIINKTLPFFVEFAPRTTKHYAWASIKRAYKTFTPLHKINELPEYRRS